MLVLMVSHVSYGWSPFSYHGSNRGSQLVVVPVDQCLEIQDAEADWMRRERGANVLSLSGSHLGEDSLETWP